MTYGDTGVGSQFTDHTMQWVRTNIEDLTSTVPSTVGT
jgi:hypothetical protein